jgi:chemotaxis signal transduction protein
VAVKDDSEEQRRLRVLRERAAKLARVDVETRRAEPDFEVAVCRVGDERLALPVRRLREIVPLPPLTLLPGAPGWLLGVAQVRGTLLSVIALGAFLGLSGDGSQARYAALLDADQGPIAFTVDEVLGYRRLYVTELAERGSQSGERQRPLLGVTRDLIAVLDFEALLARPELVIE